MKELRRIFLLLVLAFALPCIAGSLDLGKRQSLSPKEAASLQQEVVYLDVRSTPEWLSGHVEDAVHMPYNNVARDFASAFPDRSVPVIPYCSVGGRAQIVVDALRKQGYTVVPVTNGGYRELIANGMKKD
jgi:phage shock protein E